MVTWRRTTQTTQCFSSNLGVLATSFLLAALHHAPLAAAQEQPPPWLICGPAPISGNYTANSPYQANINRLAATLPKNTSSSPVLYSTDNVGSVPDVVYGLALCRGDANASACERCVATAFSGAQRGCPLFKDVMAFYDFCQLRFSNRNFLLDDDYFVNTFYLQGSQVAASLAAQGFDAAVRRLVNATADYAAENNSSRRYGTGEMDLSDDRRNRPAGRIYALSQCTPDRTEDVCRTCLHSITAQLTVYFNGTDGGGVFGVWCNFRYELHPFFSGPSLVQLPAIVAAPPEPPKISDKSKNKTGMALAIVMPSICAVLVITMICFSKRRSITQPDSTTPDDIEGADMLLLDLSTLRTATQDFDESKMLGRGGFGIVYKGILPEGQEIAVKRLSQSSRQGIGELKSELVLVAKLHHRNLVRLLGVCLQEHEKILVYEYMPNKSLDTFLFESGRNKELDWVKRFKIICGTARGLQYLHEDSQLRIVHRDLKASNVLLDTDFTPKISDFGLAKNFEGDQSKYVTHRIAGTYGYMAPEYAMRGQYSMKSDVFSFGVLVLEIVTGRRNSGSYDSNNDVDLLNLVWDHWIRGNVVKLMDPSLSNHPPIEQILKCIHIGLLCVQRNPTARPTMSTVNIMLSSSTVRLPSFSRPALCIQEEGSTSDSSAAYSATHIEASDNSVVMSCNEESITELLPR